VIVRPLWNFASGNIQWIPGGLPSMETLTYLLASKRGGGVQKNSNSKIVPKRRQVAMTLLAVRCRTDSQGKTGWLAVSPTYQLRRLSKLVCRKM